MALTLLSACDASGPSASSKAAATQPEAPASSSFFTATVPAPTAIAAVTSVPVSAKQTASDESCLTHVEPQRFESIGCLAGMHTGSTSDGTPCRLMVDVAQRRMTFQAGTTTVSLSHERLAMTAQGEVVYNLEALRNATGIDGVRLMHMQSGAARADQTVTQSITLMAPTQPHQLSWTYAQDGIEPTLRVACHVTS